MSSTLFIKKTPKQDHSIGFKLPIKGAVGRRYYDHDGSLGGGLITVAPADLPWWEGLLEGMVAGSIGDKEDRRDLEKVVKMLRDGHSIDMWFEV